MACLVDYSHPALTESPIELIAAIKHSIPRDGGKELITVSRTVVELIREAMSTSRTFFHLLAWSSSGLAMLRLKGTWIWRPTRQATRNFCAGKGADNFSAEFRLERQ